MSGLVGFQSCGRFNNRKSASALQAPASCGHAHLQTGSLPVLLHQKSDSAHSADDVSEDIQNKQTSSLSDRKSVV